MYSNIPGVQILLSLLKQHNIRHLVISPGTRNTALVHSVECDDFFKCYSVVDERSAGFFALGLSEELDVPVCVTCTAATATCNYMPAIKEAYERNIQLVALTADQDTYSKFHMGDQNINQTNMYDNYVKCAVDVPKIQNKNDYWYFNRCVNEALLSLNHNGKGPIQINFRMDYTLEELSYFPKNTIDKTRCIKRYNINDINWNELSKKLENKKIIVFCGSEYMESDETKKSILEFKKKTGAVILADYYSNIIDDEVINPSVLGDVYGGKDVDLLKPDLIILTGSVVYAPIKFNNGLFKTGVVTWEISEDGRLNDGFRNVEKILEMKTLDFFVNINSRLNYNSNKNYYNIWKNTIELIKYPDLEYTHFNAIKKFLEKIPNDSIIHMSVLDAIRISNYLKMPNNVRCFANIGADGIDGALSTFLGQASKTDKLSFLLIGDLSLMYDMNALYSKIPSNVRIIVINNFAGSEFYKNFGLERIKTLNKHIAAGHNTTMEQLPALDDFKYLRATNDEELDNNLNIFKSKSDKPIILEIITDANQDANKLKEFWKINKVIYGTLKTKVASKLSPKLKSNIKKILRK